MSAISFLLNMGVFLLLLVVVSRVALAAVLIRLPAVVVCAVSSVAAPKEASCRRSPARRPAARAWCRRLRSCPRGRPGSRCVGRRRAVVCVSFRRSRWRPVAAVPSADWVVSGVAVLSPSPVPLRMVPSPIWGMVPSLICGMVPLMPPRLLLSLMTIVSPTIILYRLSSVTVGLHAFRSGHGVHGLPGVEPVVISTCMPSPEPVVT